MAENGSLSKTVIRPSRGWSALNLRDLWEFRELVYFMTWRDIKVRYKQTLLGAAWAVLKPFLNMVVFTIFFSNLAKVPSDGVPYPIFSFAGLLPWELFSNSISNASRSLVQNRHMITKIYFPRIILPLANTLSSVVDFMIAFVILLVMMVYYKVGITVNLLYIPVFLLLAIITALGAGLWLAALNVLYRDIGYVTPFLIQLWMFVSPIVYPTSMLPEKWRLVYAVNPMVSVVEGFRWSVFGSQSGVPGLPLIISSVAALVLLVSGLFYFKRMERYFADLV